MKQLQVRETVFDFDFDIDRNTLPSRSNIVSRAFE